MGQDYSRPLDFNPVPPIRYEEDFMSSCQNNPLDDSPMPFEMKYDKEFNAKTQSTASLNFRTCSPTQSVSLNLEFPVAR